MPPEPIMTRNNSGGPRYRLIVITSVLIIAYLAYTYHSSAQKRKADEAAKRDARVTEELSDIIPEHEPDLQRDVIPTRFLENIAIPQDAPFQISLIDQTYTYIPKYIKEYPKLKSWLRSLKRPYQRRPAAIKLALALLERFLSLHDLLRNMVKDRSLFPSQKNKTWPPKFRDFVTLRIADMSQLRIELLEQLQQVTFEFGHTSAPELLRLIHRLRDFTHALLVILAKRIKALIKDVGSLLPPFGIEGHESILQGKSKIASRMQSSMYLGSAAAL